MTNLHFACIIPFVKRNRERKSPRGKENHELLDHYKRIASIRENINIYKNGDFRLLYITIDILLFVRYNSTKSAYYTLINNSANELTVSFSSPAFSLIDSLYVNTYVLKSEDACIFKADKNVLIYLPDLERKRHK